MKNHISKFVTIFAILCITVFSSLLLFILNTNDEHSTFMRISPSPNMKIVFTKHDPSKRHILIFIGVVSAPSRKDRRTALRKTWLTHCDNKRAVCLIFTDGQDMYGKPLNDSIKNPLQQESAKNGFDMILTESPGGINFATRYLWIVEYALTRFELDYFLRIDDDQFLCIDRLLWELPYRPKTRLVWGWSHCRKDTGLLDEGWHLSTADVIKEYMSNRNTTLMCHPFGDIAIAIWLNDMKDISHFTDNARIYHDVSAGNPSLKKRSELCHTYISLHGSYPVEMYAYWQITNKEATNDYTLSPVVDTCSYSKYFKWNAYKNEYFAEPKPCKDNPTWQKGKIWVGRQEQGKQNKILSEIRQNYLKPIV